MSDQGTSQYNFFGRRRRAKVEREQSIEDNRRLSRDIDASLPELWREINRVAGDAIEKIHNLSGTYIPDIVDALIGVAWDREGARQIKSYHEDEDICGSDAPGGGAFVAIDNLQLKGEYDDIRQIIEYAQNAILNDGQPMFPMRDCDCGCVPQD